MTSKKISVAILAAFTLDEQRYKPGQIVEFNEATANDLAKNGQVDKHKDAVAHLKKHGVAVIRHPQPESEPEPAGPMSAADANPDNPDPEGE